MALLRLESEAREWRERLETAERRERDAREETSRRVASARAEALASCAIDARQLEVLKYRSLARGTTKLLERRARRAMAAFRLCVRAASRERRVERELVPKWNRVIRKRLAFKRFAGAVESRRKARVAGERVALAAILRFARRVTRAWFAETSARGALRRRAARAKATFAARRARRRVRRNLRRVGVGVGRVARRRDAEPRFCTPGTSGGGTSRYLSRRGATRRFANQRRRRTPPSWLRARPVRACIGSRGGACGDGK